MRLILRGALVALLAAGVGVGVHLYASGGVGSELPPVLISLPDFSFEDQRGETVDRETLQGHVWIANFFFTSCPSACPALTRRMKEASEALPNENLRLVSFSVDPETDTPEVLAAYAERFEVDQSRWYFLTGDPAAVTETIVQGFRLHVGDRVQIDGSEVYDIMHALRFVLVDAEGQIRGYYRSDDEGMENLERDAAALLQ